MENKSLGCFPSKSKLKESLIGLNTDFLKKIKKIYFFEKITVMLISKEES